MLRMVRYWLTPFVALVFASGSFVTNLAAQAAAQKAQPSARRSPKVTADLLNRFPDRFLFGSDTVAPKDAQQ